MDGFRPVVCFAFNHFQQVHLVRKVLLFDNIAKKQYYGYRSWTLKYLDEYTTWIRAQDEDLQDEATAHLDLVEKYGPLLKRPYADTLHGSKLSNLKELRFAFEGAPIRILFAFDPKQQGVIILGGDKTGDKRWYDTNIPIAEKLYAAHLEKQAKEDAEKAAAQNDKKSKEKRQ